MPGKSKNIQTAQSNADADNSGNGQREIGYPSDSFVPVPHYRHGSRFGDNYGGLIITILSLVGFVLICPASVRLWDNRPDFLGWTLAIISGCALLLAIFSGAIGCLPGSWHKCLCDGEEHAEYRQTLHVDETLLIRI
jgi:hypothetical protein